MRKATGRLRAGNEIRTMGAFVVRAEPTRAAWSGTVARLRAALPDAPWWAPAALVFAFYALWTAVFLLLGHDPRAFIHIGSMWVLRGHGIAAIALDRHMHYGVKGYDGQFYYFIALDPAHAATYLDAPAYRFAHIGYPLLVRLLALGQPGLVPYALIAVNILALAGGTLAVAAWMRRAGASPWLALLFGFYPGLFVAFRLDLAEPLGYALAALGAYLFAYGGQRRLLWAGLSFAAALLTRESTVLFPLAYAVALLLDGPRFGAWRARLAQNARRAGALLALALGPYAAYQAFLILWLGSPGVKTNIAPDPIPFGGLLANAQASGQGTLALAVDIALPGLVCIGAALWALRHDTASAAGWALLLNAWALTVLLPPNSYVDYTAAGRLAAGVVLAALLAVQAAGRRRWWLWASAALWLAALPLGPVWPLLSL